MINKELSGADIFDVDKKTGALILGGNRLDDYAAKFLTRHCVEALKNPMPLPVDKIIDSLGLTIKECCLSRDADIFGCCFLLDGKLEVYDRKKRECRELSFPAGTVLIDPECVSAYGEGFRRNTLVHEAVHWEKDKVFFDIMAMKNSLPTESVSGFLCRRSETFLEPIKKKRTIKNDMEWLEWQAHRLAPRILMPYEPFKKKAEEIIGKHSDKKVFSCECIVSELASFFLVSALSVKYRLKEVGLVKLLKDFADYQEIFEETEKSDDYCKLSLEEAFELFMNDFTFRKWILSEQYVFAEGFFVYNSKKYIEKEDGSVRIKACNKEFFDKAVLKIYEYRRVRNLKNAVGQQCVLLRTADNGEKIVEFRPYLLRRSPDADEIIREHAERFEAHFEKVSSRQKKANEIMLEYVKEAGWNSVVFQNKTLLNPMDFTRLKNKDHRFKKEAYIAMAVALELSQQETEEVLKRAGYSLTEIDKNDAAYMYVLSCMSGYGLDMVNTFLYNAGVPELGAKSRE